MDTVTTEFKPATPKAWAMLRKLEALAERGVDGEKFAAERKILRLKKRFHFTSSGPVETLDLFRGTFKRSAKARRIYSFASAEFDVANAVKWAIETATGIHCLHSDRHLLAEAVPDTANRLAKIAKQIAESFRALIARFTKLNGASHCSVFIRGLYDGMMNDPRDAGLPLPRGRGQGKTGRRKKPALAPVADLHIHPYTLAFGLGKQIRFSVPLRQIAADMDALTKLRLPDAN